MEAIRVDLTHMIVHDLKGPLAEVIANLNLLEQEALSPIEREYLGSAIQGVVRGFARLASMREVSIRIHNAGGPHSLRADKDLFFRIVRNLMINAIEHTPSRGEIVVDPSWSQDSRRAFESALKINPNFLEAKQILVTL